MNPKEPDNNQPKPQTFTPQTPVEPDYNQLPQTQPVTEPVNTVDVPEEAAAEEVYKGSFFSRILHNSFFQTIFLIGGAVILAIFINSFVLQSYEVYGQSMYPTLDDGDRLVISKVGRSFSRITGSDYIPDRGEIVVFEHPQEPEVQLIKRVIGLPGDRIVLSNGTFTIYNEDNPEGFNPDEGLDLVETYGEVDLTVPEGQIFVSGDNREQGGSLDSRNELGTVSAEYLVGTLKLRYLPFSEAKFY